MRIRVSLHWHRYWYACSPIYDCYRNRLFFDYCISIFECWQACFSPESKTMSIMSVITGWHIHVGYDRNGLFLCLLRIKFWVLIFIFKRPWQSFSQELKYHNQKAHAIDISISQAYILFYVKIKSNIVFTITTSGSFFIP